MEPRTVHLLAQIVRHSRAILTVFEKWLSEQPTEQPNIPDPPVTARTLRPVTHGRSEVNAPVAKGL